MGRKRLAYSIGMKSSPGFVAARPGECHNFLVRRPPSGSGESWFDPKERDTYLRMVVAMLNADNRRKVVLLDPDTGIAPSKQTGDHIGLDEIRSVWEALCRRDWLVLYQHGRRVKGWTRL